MVIQKINASAPAAPAFATQAASSLTACQGRAALKTYSVSSARRLRALGWAAEHFMKSDTGLLMNIGPQGAVVGTDIKAASTKGAAEMVKTAAPTPPPQNTGER